VNVKSATAIGSAIATGFLVATPDTTDYPDAPAINASLARVISALQNLTPS
jgi:hypothetical protein